MIETIAPWALDAGSAGTALGPARVRFTTRIDGDMAAESGTGAEVGARRRAIVDRPWTWLRQVHGSRVVIAGGPGEGAGAEADASVSAAAGVALAVLTADCGPVALASPEGVIGIAHAGWRGLLAGVIPNTVEAMRALGATEVEAALGPCIHPECYPFGREELDVVVAALGDTVRSTSREGGPALDLPAAVRASVEQAGARFTVDVGTCTACSAGHWSWRAGRNPQRQATVVWLP